MGEEVAPDDLERVRLAAAPFHTEPAREQAIHDRFGNVTAFWQRVRVLIVTPEVMEVLPVQCRVLRERMERHSRSASLRTGSARQVGRR